MSWLWFCPVLVFLLYAMGVWRLMRNAPDKYDPREEMYP